MLKYALKPNDQIKPVHNYFISSSCDSYFEIYPETKHFPPGKYLISYSGKTKSGVLYPKVYLDDGQGYRDDFGFALNPGIGSSITSLVIFPRPIKSLRIKPITTQDSFHFSEFKIKHVNNLFLVFDFIRLKIKTGNHLPFKLMQEFGKMCILAGRLGIRKFKTYLFQKIVKQYRSQLNYKDWIACYDTLSDKNKFQIQHQLNDFQAKPLITIIVPIHNPRLSFFAQTLLSISNQLYSHWQLLIVEQAASNSNIKHLIEKNCHNDKRIQYFEYNKRASFFSAGNVSAAEYVTFVEPEDQLALDALYLIADSINKNPDAKIIYSDEDKMDKNGQRTDPYFKCDWNHDLFLTHNMLGHVCVFKKPFTTFIKLTDLHFSEDFNYDLALRYAEKTSPELIYHIPKVLYHKCKASPHDKDRAKKALLGYLERTGTKAFVLDAPEVDRNFRIQYTLPSPHPFVSIIIPTRDHYSLLKKCIESIMMHTTYKNYEVIIIDDGTIEKDALDFLRNLPKNKFKVIRVDEEFNYSKLNNTAVTISNGEYICLLNNDIEVISSHWIEELLGHALQPGVGAVGARLWYPDGFLQHAGVVMGFKYAAGHVNRLLRKGETGNFNRAVLQQNFSAVSAACLMIKKSIYLELNGLDEKLKVAFNDIDFCLRLKQAGYRNVWTPYAEFIHHESITRGSDFAPEKKERFLNELNFMRNRWGKSLQDDFAYSPNLTVEHDDFSLAWPPRHIFYNP